MNFLKQHIVNKLLRLLLYYDGHRELFNRFQQDVVFDALSNIVSRETMLRETRNTKIIKEISYNDL